MWFLIVTLDFHLLALKMCFILPKPGSQNQENMDWRAERAFGPAVHQLCQPASSASSASAFSSLL